MTTAMRAALMPGSAAPQLRRRSAGASVVLVAAAGLVLAGCVSSPPSVPSPTPSIAASPSETPAAEPALDPSGTAEDNLAYFDLVNQRFLETNPVPGGRPIIDNLVDAGLDRSAMQVTADTTAIGRAVDSIQFSVRMGDACLVGQASAAGYVGIVGPPVSSTSCLAGITRPIDW